MGEQYLMIAPQYSADDVPHDNSYLCFRDAFAVAVAVAFAAAARLMRRVVRGRAVALRGATSLRHRPQPGGRLHG